MAQEQGVDKVSYSCSWYSYVSYLNIGRLFEIVNKFKCAKNSCLRAKKQNDISLIFLKFEVKYILVCNGMHDPNIEGKIFRYNYSFGYFSLKFAFLEKKWKASFFRGFFYEKNNRFKKNRDI